MEKGTAPIHLLVPMILLHNIILSLFCFVPKNCIFHRCHRCLANSQFLVTSDIQLKASPIQPESMCNNFSFFLSTESKKATMLLSPSLKLNSAQILGFSLSVYLPSCLIMPVIKILSYGFYAFSGLDHWKAHDPDGVSPIVLKNIALTSCMVRFFHKS